MVLNFQLGLKPSQCHGGFSGLVAHSFTVYRELLLGSSLGRPVSQRKAEEGYLGGFISVPESTTRLY